MHPHTSTYCRSFTASNNNSYCDSYCKPFFYAHSRAVAIAHSETHALAKCATIVKPYQRTDATSHCCAYQTISHSKCPA